jgi:uncharacterized membrane protein
MMTTEEIQRLDVEKLHNEVNQFRNHELLINSFSIALVAAAAQTMQKSIVVTMGVILLLAVMYFWQYMQLDTRARIVTYLRTWNLSYWEQDYRWFANNLSRLGLRKSTTLTFFVLGMISTLTPFSDCLLSDNCGTTVCSHQAIYGLSVLSALYGISILYFGLKSPKNKIEKYEKCWETRLAERKRIRIGPRM